MEYGCQVVHNLGIHIIMLGRVLFMFEVNTNTEETRNLQNIQVPVQSKERVQYRMLHVRISTKVKCVLQDTLSEFFIRRVLFVDWCNIKINRTNRWAFGDTDTYRTLSAPCSIAPREAGF